MTKQRVEVGYLGDTFDLWRVVRVVGVDVEGEFETSALVHA